MASFKAGKYEVFIERVKINRQGYEGGKYGQYYGHTGQDVYRYDTYPYESSLQGEIRANDMKDAKARIMNMAKFKNEMGDQSRFTVANPRKNLKRGKKIRARWIRKNANGTITVAI